MAVSEKQCWLNQPPLGGCVLKLLPVGRNLYKEYQPPLGGCVLKQNMGRI